MAKYPYGEVSFGEISLRQNFLTEKFPTAKIPTAKFPTAKFSSANFHVFLSIRSSTIDNILKARISLISFVSVSFG